jgi:phosphatidylinositol alpha 1,6-mannosyltransferase
VRVAIVTESFLPQRNGVSNTVRHMTRELTAAGHEVLLVAPGPGSAWHAGVPVVRVRSVGLPGYEGFSIGLPDRVLGRSFDRFGPDLVHLASPFALGASGLRAARRLGVPVVAAFQTDVGGFARGHGLGSGPTGDERGPLMTSAGRVAGRAADRWLAHLHRGADRTLAPSRATRDQLRGWGVPEVHLWRRGVNLDLFGPGRRDATSHRAWSRGGDLVVGYVGRLSHEKQVHRLGVLAGVPGVRLVVVGDGPARPALERTLPDARFTGRLGGAELAAAFASLDVFVHTGEHETFCQTVQEAQASGVAVCAPAAGGPLDLVDPGHTGLLFDPHDPRSLRDHVVRLRDHDVLRHALGRRAALAVAGRSWAAVVGDLVDHHYAAVLGRPDGLPVPAGRVGAA